MDDSIKVRFPSMEFMGKLSKEVRTTHLDAWRGDKVHLSQVAPRYEEMLMVLGIHLLHTWEWNKTEEQVIDILKVRARSEMEKFLEAVTPAMEQQPPKEEA